MLPVVPGSLWRILLILSRDAIRAFEQARGLALPRAPPPPPSHACGGVAPPFPPAGYSVDPSPGDLGATLVGTGRRILYWWPSDGWQLGTVARICAPSASCFTHVVAYTRQTSAQRGTVDTLLDAASFFQGPAPSHSPLGLLILSLAAPWIKTLRNTPGRSAERTAGAFRLSSTTPAAHRSGAGHDCPGHQRCHLSRWI